MEKQKINIIVAIVQKCCFALKPKRKFQKKKIQTMPSNIQNIEDIKGQMLPVPGLQCDQILAGRLEVQLLGQGHDPLDIVKVKHCLNVGLYSRYVYLIGRVHPISMF